MLAVKNNHLPQLRAPLGRKTTGAVICAMKGTWSAITLLGLLVISAAMAQEQPATILRHENFLVFSADEGEEVQIAVNSRKRTGYRWGDELRLEVIDSNSNTTLEQSVPLDTERVISYRVGTTGLHAVRVSSGWNLCTARVLERPWALVAWGQVPLSICGSVARQHFFVPEQCESFSIALMADVKGEGALVRVYDAEGNLIAEQAGDFDREERVVVEVPEGADGAAWSLTLESPEEDLALDDVTFYLGRGLPPFFCEDPQWLATFCAGEEYQPDLIDQRIAIEGARGLGKGDTITLTWQMDEVPADRVVALRLTAQDVDYPSEGKVVLNGHEPFFLPLTGDGQTQTFTLLINREHLLVGGNVLEITQDPSGGSQGMGIRGLELLVGERIKEFRGW